MDIQRVIFIIQEISRRDWQIEAHCTGGDILAITGFKTQTAADEWLESERCQTWLREHGYAR
jgi:hypothetical protein